MLQGNPILPTMPLERCDKCSLTGTDERREIVIERPSRKKKSNEATLIGTDKRREIGIEKKAVRGIHDNRLTRKRINHVKVLLNLEGTMGNS